MATQLFQLSPAEPTSQPPVYAGITTLTVAGWAEVADNPRQRDTEGRAKRAKHLRQPHPIHAHVNMARLPDGTHYKLDGHTRAHLWANGTVAGPKAVLATVWECASLHQVKDLYGKFDSKSAVETVGDQVFGSVRDGKFEFESELFKSLRFAGSVRVASALLHGNAYSVDRSLHELIEYWTPEILLLDSCSPGRTRFHTGVAAAALITLRRYGGEAIPFWSAFAIGGGIKINGEMDAVQALEERMESLRLHKQLTGSGNVYKIIRICLSAYDAWLNDFSYKVTAGGVKALQENSFSRWLTAAAKTKRVR